MRESGSPATTSIAGSTYLCAESTEKFSGTPASNAAAVVTAVVSKPHAKNTTSPVLVRARSTACETL